MFSMISIVFIVYCVAVAVAGSKDWGATHAYAYREIILRIREEGDCRCIRSAGESTLPPISSGLRLFNTRTLENDTPSRPLILKGFLDGRSVV